MDDFIQQAQEKKHQELLAVLGEHKTKLIQERLGIERKHLTRPSLDLCDITDHVSIFSFVARENLECAFCCEPDTSMERTSDICDIIQNTIPQGKFVHLDFHHNTDRAIESGKKPYDLLAYAEVWLKEEPQDPAIQTKNIDRFIQFFTEAHYPQSNPSPYKK